MKKFVVNGIIRCLMSKFIENKRISTNVYKINTKNNEQSPKLFHKLSEVDKLL